MDKLTKNLNETMIKEKLDIRGMESTYGSSLSGPSNIQQIDEVSKIPKITYGRDKLSSEEVKIKEAQEKQWRLDRMPDPYQENKFPWQEEGEFSFAHGGDFITNGPQKILVGDNPGGRERVTITPLDSEDYKPKGHYGKAHSLLEALYEDNKRRKKY